MRHGRGYGMRLQKALRRISLDEVMDEEFTIPDPTRRSRRRDLPRRLDHEWALTNSADLLTHEQVSLMRRHYYGFVSFLDAQFGRLLDAIEERGLPRSYTEEARS